MEALACGNSMARLGLRTEDPIDDPGLGECGAARFVDMASEGEVTLFT